MNGTETGRGSGEVLLVRVPDGRVIRVTGTAHLGRDHDCDVQIDDVHVSRRHAVLARDPRDGWIIRDLQSRNGLFLNGQRVDTAVIADGITVTLGSDGPQVVIRPESAVRTPPAPSRHEEAIEGLADRYFQDGDDEDVGGRTLMIRKAFKQIQQQQKRRHRWTVGVLALAGLAAAVVAFIAHQRAGRQEELAENLFYTMKALDVNIARVEQMVAASGNADAQREIAQYRAQRRQLENDYEQYLGDIYDPRLSEKERLILRVTRTLGECEAVAPPDYVQEVTAYIQRWQATSRFTNAMKEARDLGYTKRIVDEFVAQNLPPQFFYLAMQESNFDRFISGPRTKWGIAKGMWQFIPETGQRYGLRIGPLASTRVADAGDERFDWQKATVAAARYIKDLYTTDAQASGLLVMASYNWGENRVLDLVRTLPNNPRDRNFWKLQQRYRLPKETRDYVFNIVAAAVIGENPRLFGFDFDSPLRFAQEAR